MSTVGRNNSLTPGFINSGIAIPRSEDKSRFYVDKTLLLLIPGITRVSRVIPS